MQPKSDNTLIWLAVIGVAFYWYSTKDAAPKPVPDSPAVVAPSAEMQSIVAPIKATSANNPTAAKVFGSHWRAMAQVLPASDCCETTADFAELVKRWQSLIAANGPAMPVPGLGASLDAATKQAFGDDIKPLDKSRAAEFCSAVAWALGG